MTSQLWNYRQFRSEYSFIMKSYIVWGLFGNINPQATCGTLWVVTIKNIRRHCHSSAESKSLQQKTAVEPPSPRTEHQLWFWDQHLHHPGTCEYQVSPRFPESDLHLIPVKVWEARVWDMLLLFHHVMKVENLPMFRVRPRLYTIKEKQFHSFKEFLFSEYHGLQ